MSVVAGDLKAVNGGRIEPTLMFPDEDAGAFDQRLEAYIAEGAMKAAVHLSDAAEIDDATKAWAYYRAFDAHFIRLSSSPASVTLNDQGSASMLVTQIQNFRDLADAALAEYEDLIAPEAASTTTGWKTLNSLRH